MFAHLLCPLLNGMQGRNKVCTGFRPPLILIHWVSWGLYSQGSPSRLLLIEGQKLLTTDSASNVGEGPAACLFLAAKLAQLVEHETLRVMGSRPMLGTR